MASAKTPKQFMDRPQMFRGMFTVIMTKLGDEFWLRGPKGHDGGWGHGASRKRIRALARKMAREEMRKERRVVAS